MKITNISAHPAWWKIDFRELIEYKELLWILVLRDIRVRYKQTAIGALWALAQPVTTMIVFSFFFGKIAGISVGDIPYPLFSYAGLTLWTMFSSALSQSSQSLIASGNLISKVYFPRIIIPIASTIVAFVDYLIALSLVIVLHIYYRHAPSAMVFLLPLISMGTLLLANGIGFFLSALNVQFRDVRYALPFFIQLLIFVSPVIYPVSLGGSYRLFVEINPMSGFLETHRALLLNQIVPWASLGYSFAFTFGVLVSGYFYFSFVQKKFADVI